MAFFRDSRFAFRPGGHFNPSGEGYWPKFASESADAVLAIEGFEGVGFFLLLSILAHLLG